MCKSDVSVSINYCYSWGLTLASQEWVCLCAECSTGARRSCYTAAYLKSLQDVPARLHLTSNATSFFYFSLVCQDRSWILTASLERWSFPEVASPAPDLQRWLLYSLEKHNDISIHFLSFWGHCGNEFPWIHVCVPFRCYFKYLCRDGRFLRCKDISQTFSKWFSICISICLHVLFYLKDAFQRKTQCPVDSAIFANNKIQYEKV